MKDNKINQLYKYLEDAEAILFSENEITDGIKEAHYLISQAIELLEGSNDE